jgi:hypothetical protein
MADFLSTDFVRGLEAVEKCIFQKGGKQNLEGLKSVRDGWRSLSADVFDAASLPPRSKRDRKKGVKADTGTNGEAVEKAELLEPKGKTKKPRAKKQASEAKLNVGLSRVLEEDEPNENQLTPPKPADVTGKLCHTRRRNASLPATKRRGQ